MRSSHLVDIVRRVADHVAAGYFPADDGVSMIAREADNNVALLREVRTQLGEDPDTPPVCLSLLDRAAEMADRPTRALYVDRPDATRLSGSQRMGRRLTGLTPSDQLAAQCPTCRGDQRILMWVAATHPGEDNPEITHGYHQPAVRDCPDCGGTGRVKFGG